jgi:hypothetical protein
MFVLALVAGCALFLAATTKAESMLYVFGGAFFALCSYVYVIGQLRQRELAFEPVVEVPMRETPAMRRAADRWSQAV